MQSINERLAEELNAQPLQVIKAVELLDQGSTVPFIARYRKDLTGGLDDGQLRTLELRLAYLRELEERREVVLRSIQEQEKLTPQLAKQIQDAQTKVRLEDLYLPYKPKRRTKAQIAKEAGLEPLALALYEDPQLSPEETANGYIDRDKGIDEIKLALEGARQILMEKFSEDAELLAKLREYIRSSALVESKVIEGKEKGGAKFSDYFDYSEALSKVPSHRALALFRGRKEGVLSVSVREPENGAEVSGESVSHGQQMVAGHWCIAPKGRAADYWLEEVIRWTWRIKLFTHLELECLNELRERAEQEAIRVFSHNLKDLLLAAPAGNRVTIGLDPALRTGVKLAVVDETGKVLDHGVIYPNKPQLKIQEAEAQLVALCNKHHVSLIAIGNGTGSRDTDKFVGEMLKSNPGINAQKVIVNEAGASVYSASEFAAKEFPDLDVTIRGAVSIARRLQDPLAELVKIEPKSIGVGQYQHDVSQVKLAQALGAVIEDCVNAVGVEVNTASAPLLSRVSGLNQTVAENIVVYRDANGKFKDREALKQVPRFGAKSFEQAAGFLRINAGQNPLDCSAVHPESYHLVQSIVQANQCDLEHLLGNTKLLNRIDAADFISEKFGVRTVEDLLAELDKPGRDPRPEFKVAQFNEEVERLADLKPGMRLEGSVTNVTNFGAFVDVGVHQDGLVHISALSDRFVKDPREVVKTGDIVKVKVMSIDIDRKRIALTMRLKDEPPAEDTKSKKADDRKVKQERKANPANIPKQQKSGTMAELLFKAGIRR